MNILVGQTPRRHGPGFFVDCSSFVFFFFFVCLSFHFTATCLFESSSTGPTSSCVSSACLSSSSSDITGCLAVVEAYCTYQLVQVVLSSFVADTACTGFGPAGHNTPHCDTHIHANTHTFTPSQHTPSHLHNTHLHSH